VLITSIERKQVLSALGSYTAYSAAAFEELLLELLSVLALLEVLFELPESEALELEPEPVPDTFFLLPVLKSVSYQPPPLSLKAAAETNFFKVD
jgi:hypothetical protein